MPAGMAGATAVMREFGVEHRGKKVPKEDFDLESSETKMQAAARALAEANGEAEAGDEEAGSLEAAAPPKPHLADAAYNKSDSFFDSLTSKAARTQRHQEKA